MCVCCVIYAASRIRGPTAFSKLTLPICAYPSAAVLLTRVRMCSRWDILISNRWNCATYAASYGSFIIRYPPVLSSVRRRSLVDLSTDNLQTCYSPVGLRHTPPIPSRGEYVVPIHVGLSGRISRR